MQNTFNYNFTKGRKCNHTISKYTKDTILSPETNTLMERKQHYPLTKTVTTNLKVHYIPDQLNLLEVLLGFGCSDT